MELILIIISAIILDEICWRLILHSVNGYARRKERIYDMSKYKEDGYRVNKQTVYKVEGDFNGDIKGDNVTVILMGNGDFNGDINSKDGEVVLIKGSINGDVKANKVLCPTDPNVSDNGNGCTECVWFDGKDKTCAWDVDKKDCPFLQHPKQVKCSDCIYSRKKTLISLGGKRECYECLQFNKEVDDNYRNCQSYKPVNRHNDDSTTKHNPARDVKSPKLQVETLWSCDIPQSGASPYERVDFVYDGDKCVNRYKSLALANVTCPHCRKSFSKDFKVVTTVIDGEVSNTEIQNYGGYILD